MAVVGKESPLARALGHQLGVLGCPSSPRGMNEGVAQRATDQKGIKQREHVKERRRGQRNEYRWGGAGAGEEEGS